MRAHYLIPCVMGAFVLLTMCANVVQPLSVQEISDRQYEVTMDMMVFFQEEMDRQREVLEERMYWLEVRLADIEDRQVVPAVTAAAGEKDAEHAPPAGNSEGMESTPDVLEPAETQKPMMPTTLLPNVPTTPTKRNIFTTLKATTDKATTRMATIETIITPVASTLKATTERATTPKATTERATTPKATTERATTPKATTERATTPKATTEKITMPMATTEKIMTERAITERATTKMTATPRATTKVKTTMMPTTKMATTKMATTILPKTKMATTSMPKTKMATTKMATNKMATNKMATTLMPTTEKVTTTMATTKMATTKMLTTKMATTAEQTLPVSCAALFSNGVTTSGDYQIDPDGSGEVLPFTVYCDMDQEEGITIVGHSVADETIKVVGFEKPGTFSLEPIYDNDVTMAQLGALADASLTCSQYAKYSCKLALLMGVDKNGLPYGWWVDRHGNKRVNWAGAPTDSRMCACGVTQNCFEDEPTCSCDHPRAKNQIDEGYFGDKDNLPVMSIRLGDTGGKKESAAITLGKFMCRG